MHSKIILTILLIFGIHYCYSQTKTDSIYIQKTAFGTVYKQNNKTLTMPKLKENLIKNNAAYQEYKTGMNYYWISSAMGFAGGFMLGWELYSIASGNDANWVNLGIAGGLTLGSIPITKKYRLHMKNAIEHYNSSEIGYIKNKGVEMQFALRGTGVSMLLTF